MREGRTELLLLWRLALLFSTAEFCRRVGPTVLAGATVLLTADPGWWLLISSATCSAPEPVSDNTLLFHRRPRQQHKALG